MSIYARNLASSIAILHSVALVSYHCNKVSKGILYAPSFRRRLVLHAEKYLNDIVSRRSLSLAALTFAKPRFFDSSERRGEPSAAGKMGVVFVEHMGGVRLFSCQRCDTNLTNREQLISTRFTGGTGRAYLFHKVVNVKYSELQDRVMLTGRHIVRDVSCKNCNTKLGWMYEYAHERTQEYKEGKIILEKALILETVGIPGEVRNQDQSR